jgi:transposase InsO family protein
VEARPYLRHIRTRHCAPEANGGVERSNQTLKYDHLYQGEIEQEATLAEGVESSLATFNEVRPHEPLGQRIPLLVHRGDQHLFQGLGFQQP